MTYNVFFGSFCILSLCLYAVLFFGRVSFKQKETIILMFILAVGIIVMNKPLEVKDTLTYSAIYNSSISFKTIVSDYGIRFGNRISGFDTGFLVYMCIIKSLGVSFKVFVFIHAIIVLVLSTYGFFCISKEMFGECKLDIFEIAVLFMVTYGLHYTAIAMRGGLSIALGLCASGEILRKERRIWIVIVLLVLSVLVQSVGMLNIIPVLIFANNVRIDKKVLFVIQILILCGLIINIGAKITPLFIGIVKKTIDGLELSGFSGYYTNLEFIIGKKDWLTLIVCVAITFCPPQTNVRIKQLYAIMLAGMILLCIGYPIRAINRGTDYFFVYLIPLTYGCIKGYEMTSVRRFVAMVSVFGLFLLQMVTIY